MFDAAGTWEVLFGPDGVAPAMPSGATIAVHSTIAPDEVRALADEAVKHGLHLLDAPVSGGRIRAEAGELLTMAGGEQSTFARCEPVLRTFSAEVVHVGPVGAGQHAKLLNNALLAAHLALAADAFRIAELQGLDPAAFGKVVAAGSGRSFGAEMYARAGGLASVARSQARPTLGKDVGLLAGSIGSEGDGGVLLPAARAAIARLDAAADGQEVTSAAAGSGLRS
ncbi:NAD(P)-binding domain-containing protein [Streptomyces sp. NPDC004237]|uniref:NAD(P)-dependent oxidoreductase n=1 Tax=Streptomyces sp. NPDC004237 TaxID=3154455 RepID=UPI0033A306E2